jgi:hypothetical protein
VASSGAPSQRTALLAGNLCIYGAKVVPVKDRDTCKRLYVQPSASRNSGKLIECGVIAFDVGRPARIVSIQHVRTVGDCFGTTNSVPKSVRVSDAQCALQLPDGVEHYRFDSDPARCKRQSVNLGARIIP